MRWVKRILITVGMLFVIAGAAVYGGGCWYFQNHFLLGTEVAGFSVPFMTAAETEKLLNEEILSYALAVDTRNGGREKLTAEQVGMRYQSTGEVRKLIKDQPYLKWLLAKGENHSLTGGFKLNQEKFEQAVKELKCANNMQAPVNARILKVDGKYQIIPEVNGTQLELEKAKGLIETALKRGDVSVSLESCYKNPTVFSDDPELIRNCDILNKMQGTIITYDFGDRSEFIDGKIAEEWVVDNVLDRENVKSYVEELAEKYDTCGTERKFITYDDREIPLVGGEYGWKIDVDKEADALYDLITKGAVTVRTPVYVQEAKSRERNDIGYDYLEIDTTASRIILYIDGDPVVQGNTLSIGSLPAGCNTLQEKVENMEGNPYLMTASQNIRIIGVSPEKEALLKINQSNGLFEEIEQPQCLLSESCAKSIFEAVPENCPVVIY